jgi:hypothetical protein
MPLHATITAALGETGVSTSYSPILASFFFVLLLGDGGDDYRGDGDDSR